MTVKLVHEIGTLQLEASDVKTGGNSITKLLPQANTSRVRMGLETKCVPSCYFPLNFTQYKNCWQWVEIQKLNFTRNFIQHDACPCDIKQPIFLIHGKIFHISILHLVWLFYPCPTHAYPLPMTIMQCWCDFYVVNINKPLNKSQIVRVMGRFEAHVMSYWW